jgi:hypothetical protein
VYRGFTAHLYGAWEDGVFTLVEDFVYSDCEKERMTWRFKKLENGQWSGTRENVVGKATGYTDGSVYRLEYDMRLPDDSGEPGRKVSFKDILFKDQEGVVTNNAVIGWNGFKVGKVELVIKRMGVGYSTLMSLDSETRDRPCVPTIL